MEEVRGLVSKGVKGWVIQAVILLGLLCVVTPLTSSDGRNPVANSEIKLRSFFAGWNKTYINSRNIPCCGSIPLYTGPDAEFTEAMNKLKNFREEMQRHLRRARVDWLEENLGAEGAIFAKVGMGILAAQVLLGIVVCVVLRRCAGRSVDLRGTLARGQHITVEMGNTTVTTQGPQQPVPIRPAHRHTQQSRVTVTCHQPAELTAHLLPPPPLPPPPPPQGNDASGHSHLFVPQRKTQQEE